MQNVILSKVPNSTIDIPGVIENVLAGEDISPEDALQIYEKCDFHLIGQTANYLRKRACGDIVTFVVDRNINYTNVCTSKCKFCAFYREEESDEAYVLNTEELISKVQEAVDIGATQILLQGGLHPHLPFEFYEDMLAILKQRFPGVQLHALSPPEIAHIAKMNHCSVREVISRLHDAGLDSIPGGGAEILDDRVRSSISPDKVGWKTWRQVMITAHKLDIPTTATMVFGHIETLNERIRHITRIRDIQRETGGFTAFIPWTFQEKNTALEGMFKLACGVDYLRTIAISRIILNNYIPNIQASWVTQGSKVAQLALCFGANDLGGTMIEENVVRAAGTAFHKMANKEIVHMVHRLGRQAARRDTLYKILQKYQ